MLASRTPRSPLRRLALLGAAFVVSVLSCGREAGSPTAPGSAPGARYARGLSIQPVFPKILTQASGSSGLVAFDHVHIVLLHADGTVALDTVVTFPPGADQITVSLTVTLASSAPAGGEPLALNLDYVNAAGVTVFHGGPVTVTATPTVAGQPPPPPVEVPVAYTGPGASAVSVQISPKTLTVFTGDPISFSAVALDASNAPVPNTPVFFTVTDGPATVSANGSGSAGSTRGTARVVAQLLTGPTDAATVTVQPRASAIALVSGSGQAGVVGSPLGAPVVVHVTATDGGGVGGVGVGFAAGSGGSAGSATTDATGTASTTWTLGPTLGPQTLTITSGSLAGSPLTVTATATPKPATKLVITGAPATTPASTAFGVTVTAQDADGNVATTFSGAVSLAVGAAPAGGGLSGSTSATAVAGVATFSGLQLNAVGSYTLVASSGLLTPATSGTITVTPGPPTKIAFTTGPSSIKAMQAMPPVVVTLSDAGGNVATGFSGTVAVGLSSNPGGGTLSGGISVSAVAGVATFTGLTVNKVGAGYTLVAGASGAGATISGGFTVSVGNPASCGLVSGYNQSAPASTTLAPIVVVVTDAGSNPVPSASVNATVTQGGGSLAAALATTNAQGRASFTWTTGAAAGPQQLRISCAGVATGLTVTATASGTTGSMQVFGGNNQFAVASTTVLTPPSVIVTDVTHNPVSGVAVTFTPSAGSTITGPATVATGSNGIATVGGWTLGATGSFTLTASATGYTSVVFTGTVNTVPMSVTSAEKLPNGTQQFSVTGGNPGDTYTWTVNGITGGNSTFGTITGTGFYTAPATPPNPATFSVCAQSVQTPANRGCINVTITATPSAGGELIVINDVNWGDNSYGLANLGATYPGNLQFVRNLVGFTPTGVRSSASKVLLMDDSFSSYGFNGQWSGMKTIIEGLGYTTVQTSLHSDLNSIPGDVKLVILMTPGYSYPAVPFATSQINGLKTFASQGGRILFIGENGGYYANGLALEDAFLAGMGALMTNTGACDAPGVIVNSVPHQLTAGIAASGSGGFYMNCVSHMNLGPNDFALMNYGGVVVAAIAKIDLTLTPVVAASRQAPSLREVRVHNLIAPQGAAGWTTTGPPPAPPPPRP